MCVRWSSPSHGPTEMGCQYRLPRKGCGWSRSVSPGSACSTTGLSWLQLHLCSPNPGPGVGRLREARWLRGIAAIPSPLPAGVRAQRDHSESAPWPKPALVRPRVTRVPSPKGHTSAFPRVTGFIHQDRTRCPNLTGCPHEAIRCPGPIAPRCPDLIGCPHEAIRSPGPIADVQT